MLLREFTESFPDAPAPPSPTLPSPDAPSRPAPLSPWAWAAAVVLGQPNAHRVVRAFFLGLIGLASVLLGALRACHG